MYSEEQIVLMVQGCVEPVPPQIQAAFEERDRRIMKMVIRLVSHEVNNSLTLPRAYFELADGNINFLTPERLEQIQQSIGRIAVFTEQLARTDSVRSCESVVGPMLEL